MWSHLPEGAESPFRPNTHYCQYITGYAAKNQGIVNSFCFRSALSVLLLLSRQARALLIPAAGAESPEEKKAVYGDIGRHAAPDSI